MSLPWTDRAEWLETDGLGGFAMGTASGIRTRRYHGLLLVARTPPSRRMMLVNGLDVWVETPSGKHPLSSHRYLPGVIRPDGMERIVAFETEPWPQWTYLIPDGIQVEHEIFVRKGSPGVALRWRLRSETSKAHLILRPLISGRGFHDLHQENDVFNFNAEVGGERVVWRPYSGVPGIVSLSNARYTHEPTWYRGFLYSEETARGLGDTEDLGSPGTLRWDLAAGEAVWILASLDGEEAGETIGGDALARYRLLRERESARRSRLATPLHRAADAYTVRRGEGRTIIAGYPWFGDWGRDTFIALRGLCLATGRFDDARDILLSWAPLVSEGMLPNRFADQGVAPEYNSVDASLWYVIAVAEYLEAADSGRCGLSPADKRLLRESVDAILIGYSRGTRFGIRLDNDGLLAAGEPGIQLTWMDAKVGDWVVTPRSGKPVEVEALWLNALRAGAGFSSKWQTVLERGTTAFRRRFWNPDGGFLFDVIDVDHQRDRVDAAFRPNQVFGAGGLPYCPLEPERAERVVSAVEERLLTPIGLRTLAPGEPGYAARYQGGVRERDGAYHQGTVWPWLLGPFVEAWVHVRGDSFAVKAEARHRFLDPLLRHLNDAGLGHLPEIADGDAPHTPRGCPFQAWSVAEALRLDLDVLAGFLRGDR